MQVENLYTPNKIRTFTGKYIDPFDPDPDMICIEDIAHSLSMQPRFGGHLQVCYSVAEHCIACSLGMKDPKDYLAALLHDASEAYLLDIPSPIKSRLPRYKEVEHNLMKVIAKKFGFEYPLSPEVNKMDVQQLEWEWDNLMIGNPDLGIYYTSASAERMFLELYTDITGIKTSISWT